MKLTNIPNFRVEDFVAQAPWISKLFVQLNPFVQNVVQCLAGGITFGDNIPALTKSFSQTGFQTFSFAWPFSGNPPVSLIIAQATKGTAKEACILNLAWSFDSSKNQISVSSMLEMTSAGVQAMSGVYNFVLRAST